MIVEELKKSILNYAISGNLTIQNEKFLVDEKLEDFRDELSFNIPKNWKCVKLSNISDYGKNISVCGKNIDNESWVLELEDIEKNSGILLRKVYQKERKAVSNKNKFSKGNVLYGKLRPYLNKCYIADEDGYCSTEIVPMKLDKNVINKYLQLVLMSPYFLNYVNEKSYGTKMPRLGTKDAQNSLIPLPPIEEQQRIVDKIEELFAKLDEIKPIEEELKLIKNKFPNDIKKSILISAMNGDLSFQIATENCVNIDNVIECTNLPTNWIKTKAKNILNITTGKKDANYATEDGKYLFYTCANTPIKAPTYSFDGKNLILPGNGANVGLAIYSEGKFEAYQRTYVVNSKYSENTILLKYIYYYFCAFWNEYNKDKMFGSAIPYIKLTNLENFEINIPPIEEQQRIVNKIEQLLPLCNDIEKLINE